MATQGDQSGLRRRAELTAAKRIAERAKLYGTEVEELVHELFVHQVELEIQNEELKAAQRDLSHSRNQYVELFDHAPVCYLSLDGSGVIQRANFLAAELFGYGRKTIEHKPLGSLLEGGAITDFYEHLRSTLADGRAVSPDLAFVDGRRARRYVQFSSVKREDADGTPSCLTAAVDTTDRVVAQSRIRASEAKYRAILEEHPGFVVRFTVPGLIRYANERFTKSVGLRVDQSFYNCVPDDSADEMRAAVDGLSPENDSMTIEFNMERSDDRRPWVTWTLRGVFGERGELIEVQAVGKDETDRRRSEEALKDQLVQLAQSNEDLELFASMASHDLREPLRKIRAFGYRLHDRLRPEQDRQINYFVDRIVDASARMGGMIEGMLEYARVATAGHQDREVDTTEIVRETLGALDHPSEAEIAVSQLPPLFGDPTQIRQLFHNLLSNSLKFRSPERPLVVRIYGSRSESAGRTEIVIEDNGVGFDSRQSRRIFEMFERLHSREEFEGSGMGLAICRRIVTRLGGEIAASSRVGEGTKIIVRLPLSDEPASREAAVERTTTSESTSQESSSPSP